MLASCVRCKALTPAALVYVRRSSTASVGNLGLRTSRPPDSGGGGESNSNGSSRPPSSPTLSDEEWEIKTGRASRILQETLPSFFTLGLVSDSPPPIQEPIYSPKIKLSYTPSARLLAPFPETLHLEGLPLYLASSMFIRHTLNALYTDLGVTLQKVSMSKAPNPSKERKIRDKRLLINARVHGINRLSGSSSEWLVNSTYTFSPTTGLIHVHTINSIHPEPHQGVYDSVRESLSHAFGLAPERPRTCTSATEKNSRQ